MHGCQGQHYRFALRTLLCGMLQREARQLVNLLGGERAHCIGAGGRVLICECGFAISEACYDGSDGTGMKRRQPSIDRPQRGLPGGLLAGREQLLFGYPDGGEGTAGLQTDVLMIAADIDRCARGGRPVFEDALAWPAQGVRYWSRSHPLSRSRSFQ